jgi:hypothetical protein
MATKETVLDRIEIVFQEDRETGDRFPMIQARGKVIVDLGDGTKIDAGTFRFSAKAPDQDAGDQPDAPDPTSRGQKVAVSQAVKDQLRAAQSAHVTQELADRYTQYRQRNEQERGVDTGRQQMQGA